MMNKTISKKIVLIGEFAVGKTSLIRRYVENQFSDDYLTTIGVKISRKNVTVDTIDVQMLIWDIEGRTGVKTIDPLYFTGAAGAIVVADSTRQETIDSLPQIIEMFLRTNPRAPIMVALNKSDLLPSPTDGAETKSVHANVKNIYRTSAKSGENIDRIFSDLAKVIVA